MSHIRINRRTLFFTAAALTAGNAPFTSAATAELPAITAYRNPGCGCCEKWMQNLKQAGFPITMEDDPDLAARKARDGVPENMSGCHTAYMGDYVIEGHVPLEDIKRLIAEKPEIRGLAVPGMPMGSEGMETGTTPDPYDVLAFKTDGTSVKFASH
jgi:hypothetical protein